MAMQMMQIPSGSTDRCANEATVHAGKPSSATWHTSTEDTVHLYL
jgi:hypothetical protein